jgi:hypothetical protein
MDDEEKAKFMKKIGAQLFASVSLIINVTLASNAFGSVASQLAVLTVLTNSIPPITEAYTFMTILSPILLTFENAV